MFDSLIFDEVIFDVSVAPLVTFDEAVFDCRIFETGAITCPELPTETVEQNTGGQYPYRRRKEEVEEEIAELPKAVRKAVKQVAKLNLSPVDAQKALEARIDDYQQQYLTYALELQGALQASVAYENAQLMQRLTRGAYQASIAAAEERNRRIKIIMQLI